MWIEIEFSPSRIFHPVNIHAKVNIVNLNKQTYNINIQKKLIYGSFSIS